MRSLTSPIQRLLLAGALVFASHQGNASDHLDTAAVIADPASDIGDLYAWSTGKKLNLVMTIVGKKFSDHVRYEFHIDSGKSPGNTTETATISCEFNSAFAPDCRVGDIDRARGDASSETGLDGERHRFRVFAGLRDDPFFNNVRGTRAALNAAAAALTSAPKDAAGCPQFDAATSAKILDEWRHTEGHAATNLLEGWATAALVIEIDLDVVDGGGPLLGVWATTTVRGVTPGHKNRLDDGVAIDRMGRALTGNALLGLFASEEVSDALKSRYNQSTRDAWSSFEQDVAASLALYDAFDGRCGNQWFADRARGARYQRLARLLADDRLWVNSVAHTCQEYLSVELKSSSRKLDCGGRTPNHDAVDVFRSLLVLGRTHGVDDGVARDDREHSDLRFPFLAPSTPDPR